MKIYSLLLSCLFFLEKKIFSEKLKKYMETFLYTRYDNYLWNRTELLDFKVK